MDISSMTTPMLTAFGQPFTHQSMHYDGILDRVEVEHDAGYRIATVVYVDREVASAMARGESIVFDSGESYQIRRVGKVVDELVEVELAT